MLSRVVLGYGAVGQQVAETAAEAPGALTVLTDSADQIETLRGDGIAAECVDPTDPEALRTFDEPVDVVYALSDDPETNRTALEAAREVWPETVRLAYTGWNATADQRAAIERAADGIVDAERTVVDAVLDTVDDRAGLRSRRLRRTLQDVDGTLAVVMHDNPDPDAIASAIALCHIAESFGVETEACYYGNISHQENRAFVNLLDLDLRNLDPDHDVSEFGGIALVDHSRPGVNDQLPEDLTVDVVIDHHPPRAPVEARFVDLRSDVGATSTLLVDYLRRPTVDLTETVATALLYGIRVDTKDFSREVSHMDFEAAAYLLSRADDGVLERIESPSVSADTFDTIARAIDNRELDGPVLTTSVGRIRDRDTLAQAADRLLDLENVTTTLVYGIIDDSVFVSARARATNLDLGETLRTAFGQIGSAGGHADMAGAQIPLGVLSEFEDDTDESIEEVVRQVITGRFSETIRSRPSEVAQTYAEAESGTDFPLLDDG